LGALGEREIGRVLAAAAVEEVVEEQLIWEAER